MYLSLGMIKKGYILKRCKQMSFLKTTIVTWWNILLCIYFISIIFFLSYECLHYCSSVNFPSFEHSNWITLPLFTSFLWTIHSATTMNIFPLVCNVNIVEAFSQFKIIIIDWLIQEIIVVIQNIQQLIMGLSSF